MNVLWRLPDGSEREQTVADPEQLLFVLRLVRGVTIEGVTYRISGSTLVVEEESLSVAVCLL